MMWSMSACARDKNSSKTITQHFYLKELMNSQLKDLLVSASTKPKVKLKILNEIIRRKLNGINTRIRG
jgi:aspartate/glutamate racemase